jgi:hypothetical protein
MNPTNRRIAARLLRNVDTPFRSGIDLGIATLRDLSVSGAGVVLPQPVEVGAVIAVELPENNGSNWHLKLFRVAHVAPLDQQNWLVGGPFLQTLSAEELQRLS